MPAVPIAHTVGDILKSYHELIVTKKSWVDLSRNYRNYYFAESVMPKFRQENKNNESFRFNYKTGGYRNGVWDHYFNPDSVDRQNVLDYGTAIWSMYKTSWVFDRREPGAFGSSSPEQIQNHLDAQRANFEQGVFDDFEQAWWTLPTAPNDGSAGSPVMNGLPYMITKATAATTMGPNGANPSGYSSVFGKDRDAAGNRVFRNYASLYSVLNNDALDLLDIAIKTMRWKAPRSVKGEKTFTSNYEIVSHLAPLLAYQKLLRNSNENIGTDAGKYQMTDEVMFHGVRWNWTDALTSPYLRDDPNLPNPAYDVTEPIYLLNWDTFELIGAEGEWMRETEPKALDNPHNTYVGHLDSTQQAICVNPRQNAVISKAA